MARLLVLRVGRGRRAPLQLARVPLPPVYRAQGGAAVRELHGEPEDMVFALPKELRLQLIE